MTPVLLEAVAHRLVSHAMPRRTLWRCRELRSVKIDVKIIKSEPRTIFYYQSGKQLFIYV
jgi:hypothetical protein